MESIELRTLERCTPLLEKSLKILDRKLVHFLKEEYFIPDHVRDEVLETFSVLNETGKAGKLVTCIKNRVDLDPRNYYVLVDRLKKEYKLYEPILKALDKEHNGK